MKLMASSAPRYTFAFWSVVLLHHEAELTNHIEDIILLIICISRIPNHGINRGPYITILTNNLLELLKVEMRVRDYPQQDIWSLGVMV